MILSLLVGLLVGLAVHRVEPWFRDFAESVWLEGLPIEDSEFDLAALLLSLILAALILALFAGGASAFWLCVGALVGLFGKRIWAKVTMKDKK